MMLKVDTGCTVFLGGFQDLALPKAWQSQSEISTDHGLEWEAG